MVRLSNLIKFERIHFDAKNMGRLIHIDLIIFKISWRSTTIEKQQQQQHLKGSSGAGEKMKGCREEV